jgi:hypothetical protein
MLLSLVHQALQLSDSLGLTDTSIALNSALVTLDGVGRERGKACSAGTPFAEKVREKVVSN